MKIHTATDEITKKKHKKISSPQSKSSMTKEVNSSQKTREIERESSSPSADESEEVDDQTDALLRGFQSDEEEGESLDDSKIPHLTIPTRKEVSKVQEKILNDIAKSSAHEKPGVVYVGRIPHGFYENEMRGYFKQFGTISKLRLSRNKKTGASKHYAWIKFASATVAEIVAKTMDNYLMFGHLLKVKLVPDEQVPEALFKGANKRFKKIPWNKIEGRRLAQPTSEEVWKIRIEREEKRRQEKAEKLKKIGYEFESPQIKSVCTIQREEVISTCIDVNCG
ncbi:Bgt-3930 [Blumeria graminis f. sp. tritici]|uniref:Bgt-3930 n=2 Tax=Blumeria graminis f. sp. tritici TaxID=62690 RepID=A0A9X9MM42_BLUGR|nr:Constituent of 66S pre-ribosomal particles [Blumeria graminis f. sp. tritici 96224]VDB93146.1 Bgt-3930 [Blumeria graminis f. sp. tritici]